MFDRRNDCSLMALEDHCCLLVVTLALVGGGGACRRCISVRATELYYLLEKALKRQSAGSGSDVLYTYWAPPLPNFYL